MNKLAVIVALVSVFALKILAVDNVYIADVHGPDNRNSVFIKLKSSSNGSLVGDWYSLQYTSTRAFAFNSNLSLILAAKTNNLPVNVTLDGTNKDSNGFPIIKVIWIK